MNGLLASIEDRLLADYLDRQDVGEQRALRVFDEVEALSERTVANLVHGLPDKQSTLLLDTVYEIAEQLIDARERQAREDAAAARWEESQ